MVIAMHYNAFNVPHSTMEWEFEAVQRIETLTPVFATAPVFLDISDSYTSRRSF